MSLIDPSGSAFYSTPHPERIGNPVLNDTQGTLDNVIEMPPQATPPPYDLQGGYASQDSASFAPSPTTMDQTMQPDIQPAAQSFTFQPWMLLAAGAFLVLLLREK